eukprot:INCI4718.1.p1 GENE.INCI4718.1~~INCI4718.1.p1  ORF type:complete len:226 (-),score=29.75 INCI4718.1:264-941(-)
MPTKRKYPGGSSANAPHKRERPESPPLSEASTDLDRRPQSAPKLELVSGDQHVQDFLEVMQREFGDAGDRSSVWVQDHCLEYMQLRHAPFAEFSDKLQRGGKDYALHVYVLLLVCGYDNGKSPRRALHVRENTQALPTSYAKRHGLEHRFLKKVLKKSFSDRNSFWFVGHLAGTMHNVVGDTFSIETLSGTKLDVRADRDEFKLQCHHIATMLSAFLSIWPHTGH